MLVLRWRTGDYILLWYGSSQAVCLEYDPSMTGDDGAILVVLRKPRKTGTHGIVCRLFPFTDKRGRSMIAVDTDTSVKVQHCTVAGTQAGHNHKRR